VNPEKFKQYMGIVLLAAFIFSVGWKLNDSFGNRRDGDVIVFFLFIIFLVMLLAVRRILRY